MILYETSVDVQIDINSPPEAPVFTFTKFKISKKYLKLKIFADTKNF